MFRRHGPDYVPTSDDELSVVKHLPPGIYHICQVPMSSSLYLQASTAKFSHLPRYYGDMVKTAQRVIKTYKSRPSNTGVLMVGEKGSGKTLMARYICIELGLPVILVTSPWNVDELHKLLSAVEQEVVLFFDEFEKNFSNRAESDHDLGGPQNKLLTLLDGTLSGKRLFLLTVNDKWHLSNYLLSRPGRVYYYLKFTGLDSAFIREYCQEHLQNKDHTEDVVLTSRMVGVFSFDMLQALVAEMNAYGEHPADSLRFLNLNMTEDYKKIYKLTVTHRSISRVINEFSCSPFTSAWNVTINYGSEKKVPKSIVREILESEDIEDEWDPYKGTDRKTIVFSPKNIKTVDENGKITLVNQHGAEAVLEPIHYSDYGYQLPQWVSRQEGGV